MKFVTAIPICILCLLLTGCNRHIKVNETDLIGSWVETPGNMTVTYQPSPEHAFTSYLRGSRNITNFGTWALDRDHLIVTIYSNSFNTSVASTNNARIAKMNGDTFDLKDVDEQGNDRTRTYTKVK